MCTISNNNFEIDFLKMNKMLVKTLLFSGRDVFICRFIHLRSERDMTSDVNPYKQYTIFPFLNQLYRNSDRIESILKYSEYVSNCRLVLGSVSQKFVRATNSLDP